MSAVDPKSVLFRVLFATTAIAGVFLAAANGGNWGKIEVSPKNSAEKAANCGSFTTYILTQWGSCDKLTINDDNVDDHCIEWQDDKVWKAWDKSSTGDDPSFWDDADRTWEAIKVLVPFSTALCLLSVLLTLLSCACKTLEGSPKVSLATLILNFVAFVFALGAWAAALQTSQLTEDDYKGVTACSDVELTFGPGLALTIVASILLFVSVVTSIVWKARAGCA